MLAKSYSILPADLDCQKLPHHVAIIMDGNGRWATQRGLPRIAGHRQGARTLKDLLRWCKDWGVKAVTVYAFSTENWHRPTEEVSFLMILFQRLLHRELAEIQQEGIKITFIGGLTALPTALQQIMGDAMSATADNQTLQLNVAVNYGSRAEITTACQQIATDLQRQRITRQDITEQLLERYLNVPDSPDLLIRTSGEMRLSNFLLWQLAYTELYFTETLWPDFDRTDFHQALLSYQKRDRRYGQISAIA